MPDTRVCTAMRPTGTVTFLLTDIEGSSRLWEQNPDAMRAALADHDACLRAAIEAHNGRIFKTLGDGVCAVFSRTADAVEAALAAQIALHDPEERYHGEAANEAAAKSAQAQPSSALRVRIAVHTGVADEQDGDYLGPTVNRAARMREAASGGQTLLSEAVAQLIQGSLPAGSSLRFLGEHRLRDLQQPERIHELLHPALPAEFGPLQTLSTARHNLPLELNSFVGREAEMASVTELLRTSRLLTLTGTGGCGKTRLAVHVAANVIERYPDGVWFVDLAPLTDPSLIAQVIAHAIGVSEELGRESADAIAESLRDRSTLLILDNCEHLIARCASLAEFLLRRCPALRILATSREPLGIPGEVAWHVPSLSLPAAHGGGTSGSAPTLEELARCESLQLFVERATAANPQFAVGAASLPTLVQICQRLDGIPLALELAAARVRVLTVEQISERLDDRFQLLTGGSRTALPRHQTLAAAIEWSYDLLNERECLLLARLAVFVGGWTLESAQAVCAKGTLDEWAVLDVLSALVDKSLVMTDGADSSRRYRLLETVRHFARRKLHERGEEETVRNLHMAHFLDMALGSVPRLAGADQASWLKKLESEHDNMRAALNWCRSQDGSEEAELGLAGSLARFWHLRGYLAEGRRHLARAFKRAPVGEPTNGRVLALSGDGILAYDQGDYDAARSAHQRAADTARALGDLESVARALSNLGLIAANQGEYDEAQRLFQEYLDNRHAQGDWIGIAAALNNLGLVAGSRGDLRAARGYYARSLKIRRERGDRVGSATSLNNLGDIAYRLGDRSAARDAFAESLVQFRELGHRTGTVYALQNLGHVAFGDGDTGEARSRFSEAIALAEEIGDTRAAAALACLIGNVEWLDGRHEESAAWYGKALAAPPGAASTECLVDAIRGVARIEVERGHHAGAARLFGAAAAQDISGGPNSDGAEQRLRDDDKTALRSAVRTDGGAAFRAGGCIDLASAAALALSAVSEAVDEGVMETKANE